MELHGITTLLVLLTAAPAAFAQSAASEPAISKAAPARVISVEGRDKSCGDAVTALAQHVQLACDAVGDCKVAQAGDTATETVTLLCVGSTWQLEHGDSVVLEGTREEKLRHAAMRVASAPQAVESAPVRSVSDSSEARETPSFAAETKPTPVAERAYGGLSLSGGYGLAIGRAQRVLTVRLGAAIPVGKLPIHAGLAAGIASYRSGGNQTTGPSFFGRNRYAAGCVGLLVGWGAPWQDRTVGLAAEIGAGADYGSLAGSPFDDVVHKGFATHAYARVSATAQVRLEGPLRPFVALVGTHITSFGGGDTSTQSLSFELGVAWHAW
jgi:hypothetical protein